MSSSSSPSSSCPALAGILTGALTLRLLTGWAFGAAVSLIAMLVSAILDLPTGATVVCAFGLVLVAWWTLARALGRFAGPAARETISQAPTVGRKPENP